MTPEEQAKHKELTDFKTPAWRARAESIDNETRLAAQKEHDEFAEKLFPKDAPPPPPPPLTPKQRWPGMAVKGIVNEAAMEELFQLRNDPQFIAAKNDPTHPTHFRAQADWARLHRAAYGEGAA